MTSDPWYKDGLRFECTRCGNCCGGGPGMVKVTDEEVARLAKRLGVTEKEFRERHTRLFRKDINLLTEKENYDCVFYDRAVGCTVYEARPTQCRTWPFWEITVLSPRTWSEASATCPGMNHGKLHDAAVIRSISERDGTCAQALTGGSLRPATAHLPNKLGSAVESNGT